MSSCGKYRVLVADDNHDVGRTLALLLQQLGFDVRTADNGRSAFELALEFQPDAGIFDIGMPGLTGYELAAYIRREHWGRTATLIAVSGWGTDEDRALAYGAGFTHHLTKPVDFERVTALLAPARATSSARPTDRPADSGSWAQRALAVVRGGLTH